MRIEATRQFERALDGLPVPVQEEVLKAIPSLTKAFGKPHAHLGLRKLGGRIYEFRVGLKLRIVFRHDSDTLYLLLIGTHNEVSRFIRSL